MTERPHEELAYLSSFLGRPARSRRLDASLGEIWDIVATLTDLYPQLRGFVLRNKGSFVLYPATREEFFELRHSGILLVDEHKILPLEMGPDDVSIREILWDKQIVDVEGAKVERVNDVHLLIAERQWIVHVDVGLNGLLRRLGLEKPVRFMSRMIGRPIQDELISWKYVQPVHAGNGTPGVVRLTVGAQRLGDLHPGELSDILENLDSPHRKLLVAAMDPETAAEALQETDEDIQLSILESLSPEKAADIIEEMEPSQAADVLAHLDKAHSEDILEQIEGDAEIAEIAELMTHEEGTAGSLMSSDYIETGPDRTIAEAIEIMRTAAGEIEAYYYLYIHDDDGKLIGVLTLRHLLLADSASPIGNILQSRLITLDPDTPLHEIAETFLRYNFLFLPVVDEHGIQKGVVGFKDSIDELMPYLYKAWKAD